MSYGFTLTLFFLQWWVYVIVLGNFAISLYSREDQVLTLNL